MLSLVSHTMKLPILCANVHQQAQCHGQQGCGLKAESHAMFVPNKSHCIHNAFCVQIDLVTEHLAAGVFFNANVVLGDQVRLN